MITSRHNDQISGQAIGRVFRQNLLTIATMGGVVAGSWWRLWCSSFSKDYDGHLSQNQSHNLHHGFGLCHCSDIDSNVVFLKGNQSNFPSQKNNFWQWFKFLGNYSLWVVLQQYVLINNDLKTGQELFWEWCWSRARRNSGRWGTQCKIKICHFPRLFFC